MGAIDTYLNTPSAQRRRVPPPPPVVSPDTYLAQQGVSAAAPTYAPTAGVAATVAVEPLASALLAQQNEQPRFPLPTQRRAIDARQRRPRPGPSERAIERFLIDTDQPASRDDPSPLDLEGVNPVLLRQAVRLGRATSPLAVTSGARTLADQRVLYNRSQAGGSMAAPPSPTAPHVQGRALDVELTPEQRGMLGRFGLGTPVAGDEPHVELTDPRFQRQAQQAVSQARTGPPPGMRRAIRRVGQIAEEEVPGSAPLAKDIARDALRASRQTGVPASLLIGLTGQESGYGTNLGPSTAGAMGRAQFIPSTREDFIDQFGIDPWKQKGGQDILGAALHLEEYGATPYSEDPDAALASYSGGYEEGDYNNPILERARAFADTGIDRFAKGGGRIPQGPPQQMSGQYAGSKRALRQLLGPYARTEDWQDKEDRGDPTGTLHDVGYETGYAGDLSTSEDLIDYVARKLGRQNPGAGISPETVDYGTTGLESGLQFKGYDVEWLPYTHGTGPHDHLGLEWSGGSLPQGTFLGGPAGATGTTAGGGAVMPSSGGAPPITDNLGPYADLVQRQLGQFRERQRSALLPPARQELDPRRSLNPEETEDEEENLEALLGDRFRPQRRIVF